MSKLIIPTSIPREASPIEKSEGIEYRPGLYGPDGRPIFTNQHRQSGKTAAQSAFVDALTKMGCTVEKSLSGGYTVTPPYPDGANRAQRRAIDASWKARINRCLGDLANAASIS